MDLQRTLMTDLPETLTDFLGGQLVFWEAFEKNRAVGAPIRYALELGVYRLPAHPKSDLPGQSTKTLMILNNVYPLETLISVDIDDCRSTIDNCERWINKHGFQRLNHQFVQSNSLELDITRYFPSGIDFLFIDSSHDDTYPEKIGYPGSGGPGTTYKELCKYGSHLNRNGRIFLHDTKNFYTERAYGVNTEGAIAKFLDENSGFAFREHAPNEHGLGELYHKESLIA